MTQDTIRQVQGIDSVHSGPQLDNVVGDQMYGACNGEGTMPVPSKMMADPSIMERPIKVCFISPLGYGLYQPDSEVAFGGAEVQFFLLSRELAAAPMFQVFVLSTVDQCAGAEQHGRVTIIKRQGRRRLTVKPNPNGLGVLGMWAGYVTAFVDMWRTLRTIGADCYLHAGAGVEVGAYALICRLLRRRFIYVVASSADFAHPNGTVKGPLRWLYPLGLRLCDAVVCRSREQQASLRTQYGREGVLIRTGHQLPRLSLGEGEKKSTILWVGRMHPLKQPDIFLDLAERFEKEHFVMIAMPDSTHEDLRGTVQRRVAKLANVTLHERVPWTTIDQHFQRAKLFLNTSTYEGFPNTFVQASMNGTPVLSWTVDPDRVLSEEGIGMCAQGSFERLATLVRQLCASPRLLTEMGERAEAYARREHDLNRSTEELKHLVGSLTKAHPVVGG